jgi:hypothetical protein
VAKRSGHTNSYVLAECQGDAMASLKDGANQLAVHCRQTRGGQYIDVGIAVLTDRKAVASASRQE